MDFFPPNVSTYGGDVDAIFDIILIITGVVFVVVNVALLYVLFRYRHKEGRKATYSHGNLRLEVVWTAIPFLLVVFIAMRSRDTWLDIRDPRRIPAGAMEIGVVAKQFEWLVTYPGPDGRLGTGDDFEKRNQLHIPVNRPVRVNLGAEDVIHSFFLPEFRVKQDAVPGMTIPVWFEATATGEYVLGCAELCGLGHYRMRGSVTVHGPEEFEGWLREETGALSMSTAE